MEIIDLKKYLTPVENQNKNKQLEVVLFSDQVLAGSNFYNTIFQKNVPQLRKRIFTVAKNEKVIEIITSLIPQTGVFPPQLHDVEAWIDQKLQVDKVDNDIMLTWPSNDEKKLLMHHHKEPEQQVLLRKAFFQSKDQEIIRYEENAMLPGYFKLQKR